MNQRESRILLGALAAILAAAEFFRGAYDRLYWLPVSAALAATAAYFLVRVLQGRIGGRPAPGPDLPLFLFAGWAVLSTFTSINREETVFESWRIILIIVPYFLAANAPRNYSEARALAVGIAAIAMAQAIYGLYEFTSGQNQAVLHLLDLPSDQNRHMVSGTLRNKNHFAGIVEMGAFVTFGLAVSFVRPRDKSEQTAGRVLLGLPGVIMIVALVLSLSRGGWLAFAAAAPFFLACRIVAARPALARTALAALAAVFIIAGFVTGVKNRFLAERIKTLESIYKNEEDISLQARFSIWKSAIDMALDRPLLGTGWGTFKWAFPAYRHDRLVRGVSFAHNDYLQIAAGMGFPGLIFFLWFIVMVFREGFSGLSRGSDSAGLLAGLLAALFSLLVHELADFNLMLPANAMVFFAIAGLVVFVARRGGRVPAGEGPEMASSAGRRALALFVVLLAAANMYFAAQAFRAELHFNRGEKARYKGDLQAALLEFNHAADLWPASAKYQRESAVTALNLYSRDPSSPRLLREARQGLEKAVERNPLYPYGYFELAETLKRLKQTGERGGESPLPLYLRALEIDPDNPRFLAGLINYHLAVGDLGSAKTLFPRLAEIAPELLGSRGRDFVNSPEDLESFRRDFEARETSSIIEYAIFLGERGNREEAFRELAKVPLPEKAETYYALKIADAYLKLEDRGRAMDYLSRAFAARPEDLRLCGRYARMLEEDGNLEQALAVYLRGQENNPESHAYYLTIANLALRLGKDDLAFIHYRLTLSIPELNDYRKHQVHVALAQLRRKKGDLPGALADYREALKIKPNDKKTQGAIEMILREMSTPP